MISLKNIDVRAFVSSERYDLFMFLSCIGYCFAAMPDFDIGDLFKNIIIFGSAPLIYFCFKDKQYDKKIIWLFFASFIVQVLSWVNSLFVIPDFAKSFPELKLLTNLFLFVFIAFWIGNSAERRFIMFLSLIAGFVFSIGYDDFYHNSLQLALSGSRVDFGFYNAQFTTMLSAMTVIISCYLISTRVLKTKNVISFGVFIVVISLSLFVFITSQSRQIWLATLILLFLVPIIFRKKINNKMTISFYVISSVVSIGLLNTNFVQHRLSENGDTGTIVKILSFNWDNLPMDSFGIRFNSWIAASEWIQENPILGASKKAVRQVIQTSEQFQADPIARGFGHLHNYYAEILVSFGIVGGIFLVCFYTLVSQNILKHADYPTAAFYICFLVFWLIINNFESYNSKHYGLYIQNIILGCLFFMPKPNFSNPESTPEKPVA